MPPKTTKYYTFFRVKPKDVDYIRLSTLYNTDGVYMGYHTHHDANGTLRLEGFVVFPDIIGVWEVCRLIPNFGVRLMRDVDEISKYLRKRNVTEIGNHPLREVKKVLFP